MDNNSNTLNWFEIPATDLERAKKFYETIFNMALSPSEDIMGMLMTMFPSENGNGKVSGALVKSDMHKPSKDGCVIYLNANPDIDTVINRIENAGGQVVMPKTHISPEIGYMSFFIDTEGNKIGLHAQH